MAQREDIRKLSGGASLLVWMLAAVVGWAVFAGAGYPVWRVGEDAVAGWFASPAATKTATTAPSDREIREMMKLAPAAGGNFATN